MKNIYLILLISIVWYKPLFSGDDIANNTPLKLKGSIIEYINIVYDDYNKTDEMNFEIRYFKFKYTESGNVIEVYIGFDNDMLKKDGELPMLGGTARYIIDKKSKNIVDRTFFK